jgi:hypothetical protein
MIFSDEGIFWLKLKTGLSAALPILLLFLFFYFYFLFFRKLLLLSKRSFLL